jgi:phosphatidylglycerophosphate synthase
MKNYILLVKALFIAHKQYYTISNTPLHLVLCSKISYFITPFFIYLKVKPNFITMMNFILSVISIMILIFASHYFVWAIIIYIFYKILDFVDGSIARYNSISTFYGRFIDGLADIFFQSFFIFTLSFYYFIKLQDNNLLLIGISAAVLTCFDTFIYDRYSAITRWMNNDLNLNIKPNIKSKNFINLKIILLYQDIIFFLVMLLLVDSIDLSYLKIIIYLIFIITITSAIHNIVFHLIFSYKNLNYFSKKKKVRP